MKVTNFYEVFSKDMNGMRYYPEHLEFRNRHLNEWKLQIHDGDHRYIDIYENQVNEAIGIIR